MTPRLLFVTLLLLLFVLQPTDSRRNKRSNGRRIKIQARITNGEPAPPGRFPYMCSLRKRGSREHKCGATLIAPRWVITAAHCTDPEYSNSVGLSPVVVCGIHYIDSDDSDSTFNAVETVIHYAWKGSVGKGNDIALIKLDRKATGHALPLMNQDGNTLTVGQLLTAIGWGRTSEQEVADFLRMVTTLNYIIPPRCKLFYPNNLQDHMICAGFGQHQQDACTGDSGGPLLIPDRPDGNLTAGRASLDLFVGITSFGSPQCDASIPGVYTSIGYFGDWMQRVMRGEPQKPLKEERKEQEQKKSTVKEPKPQVEISAPKRFVPTPKSPKQIARETRIVKRIQRQLNGLTEKQLLTEMVEEAIRFDQPLRAKAILSLGLDVESVYFNRSNPKLDMERGSTLLHWAACYNATKSIEVLLEYGADIESENVEDFTPLRIAVIVGSKSAVKLLLTAGAEVEAKDDARFTTLHAAVMSRHAGIARILLKNKADVNAQNDDGFTPLHLLARAYHNAMFKVLMRGKADVNVADERGRVPLHVAANNNETAMLTALAEAGADLDAQDDDGLTAMHLGAFYGYIDVVKILVKAGATQTIEDDRGQKPEDIICLENTVICSSSEEATILALLTTV